MTKASGSYQRTRKEEREARPAWVEPPSYIAEKIRRKPYGSSPK
jgi:hypothetical protein